MIKYIVLAITLTLVGGCGAHRPTTLTPADCNLLGMAGCDYIEQFQPHLLPQTIAAVEIAHAVLSSEKPSVEEITTMLEHLRANDPQGHLTFGLWAVYHVSAIVPLEDHYLTYLTSARALVDGCEKGLVPS